MKKKKLYILFASILFSLCGCNKDDQITISSITTNEEYSEKIDYREKSYSEYTYDIDIDELSNLIQNGYSFAFIFEGSSCSSCISLKPSLFQYILKTKAAFYTLDVDKYDPDILYESMLNIKDLSGSNVFDSSEGTPTFMFFNEGVLKEKLPKTTTMNNYASLRRILNKRLKVDNSILIKDVITLNQLKSDSKIFFSSNSGLMENIRNKLSTISINYHIFHLNFNNLSSDFYINNSLAVTSNVFRLYEDNSYREMSVSQDTTAEEILAFLN